MRWRLIYANTQTGEAAYGDKAALLEAVRLGSPLRVAWGEAAEDGSWAVEEFSNVGFTNIMGRNDVVAQLEPALIQSHYTDESKAGIRTPLTQWNAVMSTSGRFEAVMTDVATGQVTRQLVQQTFVHWYAETTDPSCRGKPPVDIAPNGRANEIASDTRASQTAELR